MAMLDMKLFNFPYLLSQLNDVHDCQNVENINSVINLIPITPWDMAVIPRAKLYLNNSLQSLVLADFHLN